MNGKSGNIKTYTAKKAEKLRKAGKGQATDWNMSQKEAMRRRHADPEAPGPYEGWEKTIVADLPHLKKSIHLRVDEDILKFFKQQGKGHLTRMNAVLRTYVDAHKP